MYYVLLTLHVIACILLILIVLLQAGRGGGLSGAFGMGDNQTLFGTRAGDFLTKATTTVAIIFMAGSLVLAIISSKRSSSIMKGVKVDAPMSAGSGAQAQDSGLDDLSDISISLKDEEPLEGEEGSEPALGRGIEDRTGQEGNPADAFDMPEDRNE